MDFHIVLYNAFFLLTVLARKRQSSKNDRIVRRLISNRIFNTGHFRFRCSRAQSVPLRSQCHTNKLENLEKCYKMHSMILQMFILLTCLNLVSLQLFCSDMLKRNRTKYYPVRHCQRSNKTRIAAKNVANLNKCIQFAEYNQALAFNFGHGKRPRKKSGTNELLNLFDVLEEKERRKANNNTSTDKVEKKFEESADPYFNCEVLSCPEYGNMSTLINDTRFDYYSLYGYGKCLLGLGASGRHIDVIFVVSAPQNTTCFPSTGLFMYYYDEWMNYTNAANTCADQKGHLALILSDVRTNFLSNLVQQQAVDFIKNSVTFRSSDDALDTPIKIPIRHAYIGLNEQVRKGSFIDSLGVPIKCYRYRAWEPSYPR